MYRISDTSNVKEDGQKLTCSELTIIDLAVRMICSMLGGSIYFVWKVFLFLNYAFHAKHPCHDSALPEIMGSSSVGKNRSEQKLL